MAAAVESFAAKGFHGTTTRDIASAAGMSPAALYVHHRSKEELLHRISRAGHDRTLALVRESVASSDDPREQLLAVVHAFVVHHAEGHTGARIVNYELAALVPGAPGGDRLDPPADRGRDARRRRARASTSARSRRPTRT